MIDPNNNEDQLAFTAGVIHGVLKREGILAISSMSYVVSTIEGALKKADLLWEEQQRQLARKVTAKPKRAPRFLEQRCRVRSRLIVVGTQAKTSWLVEWLVSGKWTPQGTKEGWTRFPSEKAARAEMARSLKLFTSAGPVPKPA